MWIYSTAAAAWKAGTLSTSGSGGGGALNATPGTVMSVINGANAGDTVFLQAGTYPRLTLTRSFTGGRLTVQALSGVFGSGMDTNGQSGYNFNGGTHSLAPAYTNPSNTVINVRGPSSNITFRNMTISGGFTGFNIFGALGSYASNITLIDSDVSLSGGDISHINGCNNVLFEHNKLHDPGDDPTQGSEHHDGVQAENATNITITRNEFYWTSGPGHYVTPFNTSANCVQISNNETGCFNITVSNNLFHQWPGLGVSSWPFTTGKIVNNTFRQVNDGTTMSLIPGSTNLEVWNNIVDCITGGLTFSGTNWKAASPGACGGGALNGVGDYSGTPQLDGNYRPTVGSNVLGKGSTRAGTPTVDRDGLTRPNPPAVGCYG